MAIGVRHSTSLDETREWLKCRVLALGYLCRGIAWVKAKHLGESKKVGQDDPALPLLDVGYPLLTVPQLQGEVRLPQARALALGDQKGNLELPERLLRRVMFGRPREEGGGGAREERYPKMRKPRRPPGRAAGGLGLLRFKFEI
jgi:hypothetical protein